ncbi:class I SAM-dependent methyltransferase [Hamadaea tsunoensis]|uniref:class I SAM-dependent methyltransferase n=1 Tax=Hamadaea tsunoensis TaxID=53368 RepID=UPI0004207D8E|nr:class I SAM-dependent methyltransferase [Hamadaea tsunoensis]
MDLDPAALYDLLNPWNPDAHPGDRFYFGLLMAAESVLDVGCGTGAMLHLIRDRGHGGRLVGLDPDRASLDRARRRTDIEWTEGTAADAPRGDFALATMTGHAFQCLVTDGELRASLTAVREALGPDGRFVFETRHPQARAWEGWDVSDPDDVAVLTDAAGRELKVWHTVDEVAGDVVAFHETTATPDGTVLGVGHARLRFLDVAALNRFLAEAGFTIEAQYGDWDGSPVDTTSREIVTIARR